MRGEAGVHEGIALAGEGESSIKRMMMQAHAKTLNGLCVVGSCGKFNILKSFLIFFFFLTFRSYGEIS